MSDRTDARSPDAVVAQRPDVPFAASPAEPLHLPADDGDAPADRSRRRGVRAALVSLTPPEPTDRFWNQIEQSLEEQEQLEIVTRPAVRAITEPPPISQPTLDDDPRHGLAAYRPSGRRIPEPSKRAPLDDDEARRRRLVVVGVVAVVLVILGAASIMGGDDDRPPAPSSTSVTVAAPVTPPPPPPIPGLDGSMSLAATGIGPFQVGVTLGELHDLGVVTTLDQPTFDASGGACFDVGLPGASDLILRFRSPEPSSGVADPREGVLASVNIDAALGSTRLTDTGVGLGSAEEQLGAVYGGDMRAYNRSDLAGGLIYLTPRNNDGSGTGVAYITDGFTVTEISVGERDVIRLRKACT